MVFSLTRSSFQLTPKLRSDLERYGFCVCGSLAPELRTIDIANNLGTVIGLEQLFPRSAQISTAQSLTPKETSEVTGNQYSGHYGLGSFPLHSDLAHWAIPPRFFLLRCIVGTSDVFTQVLPWTPIQESLGDQVLRRALFCSRKPRIGSSGLVRAMARVGDDDILRWDPIFIKPLNREARALSECLLSSEWELNASQILLGRPGDTLIVDNWRVLHGRGKVVGNSIKRRVERVYLSEVYR